MRSKVVPNIERAARSGLIPSDRVARVRSWVRSRYFKVAQMANALRRVLHAVLILLYISWSVATWSGRPSNTPSHLVTLVIVVSCIAGFDQMVPWLKAILTGEGAKPSRTEKVVTVLCSAACVGLMIVLNLYSRAFFGYFPDLNTHIDYQRTIMVMTYWFSQCVPLLSAPSSPLPPQLCAPQPRLPRCP